MRVIDAATRFAGYLAGVVTGPVLLSLMLGTGLFLSVGLRFFQLTRFGTITRETFGTLLNRRGARNKQPPGTAAISPLSAFLTALSGAVGVGNIAGVATALMAGGPGAIFWMWIAAFLGMATKYAEIALGIHYRQKMPDGSYRGGPDIVMQTGLKAPWMGAVFSFFCMLASFGVGNATQANATSGALYAAFGIPPHICGVICAALLLIVGTGGIKRVSRVAGILVVPMSALYLAGSLAVIFVNRANLYAAIAEIFARAFTPKSAAGGSIGYSVAMAMRHGVARGLFSNEAGLGNAAIVHAEAEAKSPHAQGLWGVMEVFADTIIMCTLTALALLTTPGYAALGLDGSALSAHAFYLALGPSGRATVAISTALFAFPSMLGWLYYGERTARALFGPSARYPFVLAFCAVAYIGSTMTISAAWGLSDFLNAMMAIPNLIALLLLSKKVFAINQFRLCRKESPDRRSS